MTNRLDCTEKLKPGQAQSSSTHCAFAPVLDVGFFPRVTTATIDGTSNLIIHIIKGRADVYPAYALLLRSRIHHNDIPHRPAPGARSSNALLLCRMLDAMARDRGIGRGCTGSRAEALGARETCPSVPGRG